MNIFDKPISVYFDFAGMGKLFLLFLLQNTNSIWSEFCVFILEADYPAH
jgi:hypothetical protein